MNHNTNFKMSLKNLTVGKFSGTIVFLLWKATSRLRRLCLAALVLALVLQAVPAPAVHAASLVVNSASDITTAGDGYCTLREALLNAGGDTDTTNGDCAPGSGDDTITFSVSGAITLGNSLPSINTNITVSGPGAAALTLDGNSTSTIFTVNNTGELNLEKLTLTTNLPGYRLDAIVNYGSLRVTNSTFSNNMSAIANYPGGQVTINGSVFSGNFGYVLDNEGGSVTIVDSVFSDNIGHSLYNKDGSVSVTNTTFSGNTVNISGAGIYNLRGTLTVTQSTFSNNSTDYNPISGGGGAIYNRMGTAIVTNCIFSDNTAGYWMGQGGAILNEGNATLIVNNSTFTGNHSYAGGGAIHNRVYSKLTVDHSTFSSNFGSEGGGIGNDHISIATVTGSTFSGNSGGYRGGGIRNEYASTLTVTGSTFSGNSARGYHGGYGGGIDNTYYSTATITDSTFSGNSAGSGGGIYNTNDSTVTLKNTIVANSPEGDNCSGAISDEGYNLDSGTSCGFSALNYSYPDTDPLLDPDGLKNNGGPTQTIALQPESPAIDAVPLDNCSGDADQRGVTRPQGPACDIGAFELESPKQSIEKLIQEVSKLSEKLNQGQGNALIAKLNAAIQQLDRGNNHVAINQLQAFIHEVEALISSGVLPPEDGQPLVEAANDIMVVLSSYP